MNFSLKDYDSAVEWLFSQIAAFHQIGSGAYKPGLERTVCLEHMFGDPHLKFSTVHVAGTNGKGSVSSTLASVLQAAGYKVGLFTSPHLVDFRERIRVDGEMISREGVIDFLNRFFSTEMVDTPSFFELTTVMAFDWFARCGVDVAVIEVGLGGRLDSTNIITPEVSVITNISLDHTALLGNTVTAIASEKAGIIKPGIPAVVGEAEGEVRDVFVGKATSEGSQLTFACDRQDIFMTGDTGSNLVYATPYGELHSPLRGTFQPLNMITALTAVDILRERGFVISDGAIIEGVGHVIENSGLSGRWQKVSDMPPTICDTGHNVGGWQYTADNLTHYPGHKVIVVGFVNDKDVTSILRMISAIPDSEIVFTQASVARALPADILTELGKEAGIEGRSFSSVGEAVDYARTRALAVPGSMLFIGGSTFVVADFLSGRK